MNGQPHVDQYRLIVEGAGIVYDGESEMEARRQYRDSVSRSNGEAVTLFKGYEIVRQYCPDRERDRTPGSAAAGSRFFGR